MQRLWSQRRHGRELGGPGRRGVSRSSLELLGFCGRGHTHPRTLGQLWPLREREGCSYKLTVVHLGHLSARLLRHDNQEGG